MHVVLQALRQGSCTEQNSSVACEVVVQTGLQHRNTSWEPPSVSTPPRTELTEPDDSEALHEALVAQTLSQRRKRLPVHARQFLSPARTHVTASRASSMAATAGGSGGCERRKSH
eukprot:766480-Hanusia_phi.AAC.1